MSIQPPPLENQLVNSASLQKLYERGEHYRILNALGEYRRHEPGNIEAAVMAFRSYAAVGLVGPALELLQDGPLASVPEFVELGGRMAQMPSGRVPWDSLRSRFEHNLARLIEQHPHLRKYEADFRDISETAELYRAVDGNLHLSTRTADGHRQWSPDLCDTLRVAANTGLAHDPNQFFCAPYLVTGDRFGAVFDRLFGGTQEMFLTFTPRIYVVEPDVRMFGATIYVTESIEHYCHRRTTILLGPGCVDAFVDLLRSNPRRLLPDFLVRVPSSDVATHEHLVAATATLRAERDNRARQTIDSIVRHYDDLPHDHWRNRFSPSAERPLRIVGLTSRFTTVLQHVMRDLEATFVRLGHRFRFVIEDDDHDVMLPIRTAEAIETDKPDLVILIDHLRCEQAQVIPKNIPVLCWIQDHLPNLFNKKAGQSVGPLDFVIGYGFPECLTEFDYRPDRFLPCLVPTDPSKMLDPNEQPQDLDPYRCDLMYASNVSSTPDQFRADYRKRFEGIGLELVDAAFETMLACARRPDFCGDYDYDGLFRRVERETGRAVVEHVARSDIIMALRGIADIYLRDQAVHAAAEWADGSGGRFRLYGRGWEQRPEFAKFACGVVEHGVELGRAFRAATVSLHAGCNSALHHRVIDGLCAGGFFLIAEKPSDSVHALNQAIFQYVRQNKLSPPFQLRPDDLPQPHADHFRRFLRIRGTDPDVGVEATKEMLLNLQAECELQCRYSPSGIWPQYEKVVFSGAEGLAERLDYYIAHEDERKSIAAEMRSAVVDRFTYDVLVRKILDFIHNGLSGKDTAAFSL
ncbi:MAG: glycosyltransferase [Planctomycetota bacterium]|nr:glycosyltransferase [Planctomycetota bacterium]